MSEISDKITEMETAFTDVWKRMDDDESSYALDKYTMKDADGNTIEGVTSITRNSPQVLVNTIKGKLSTSEMQIEVSGKGIKDKDAERIESFATALFPTIDDNLDVKEMPNLLSWAIEQAALKGRIAARPTIRIDEAKKRRMALVDILPADARKLAYSVGSYGIGAFSFATIRTKAQILENWGIGINSKTETVKDYWEPGKNIILIGNEEKSQVSPYDYVPLVVQLVDFGMMSSSDKHKSLRAESVYMALRDTFENLNRMASIDFTTTEKTVRNASVIEGVKDTYPDIPEHDPTAYNQITSINEGAKLRVLEFADKNRSSISLDSKLMTDEQKGGMPTTSYGESGGTQSGRQVTALSVAEDRLKGPILKACSLFYRKLIYMVTRQIVDQKLTVVVGPKGFEEEYKWSELQGNYRIKVNFLPQDPMLDAANLAMAAEAKATGLFSNDTLLRDFVKSKNPEGEKEKIDREQAEALDPVVKIFNLVHSAIEGGQDMQAKRLAQKCFLMMSQESGSPVNLPLPTSKMTHKIFDDLFAQAMAGVPQKANARQALSSVPLVKSVQKAPGSTAAPSQQPKGSSGHLSALFNSGQQQQAQTVPQIAQSQMIRGAMKNV
jgi:hypothetical protein